MAELQFALVGEGNNDEALLPIIAWSLRQQLPSVDVIGIWANSRRIPTRQPHALAERIFNSITGVPCHILFVHRDADNAGRAVRAGEIAQAVTQASARLSACPPVMPVNPVRETEAWLLFDEDALRSGVGNVHGRIQLTLPRPNRIESIADPKGFLRDLLKTASELRGRHLDRLVIDPISVANSISDFSPLRQLPAFQAFEDDVRQVIRNQGWPERL